MAVEVNVNNLGKEIIKQLERYTYEVEVKVAQAVVDVGKKSAKKLRSVKKGKSDWNEYPKGWTVKNVTKKGKQIAEVHNKTNYQLTHLLEHGHAVKNGTGRIGAGKKTKVDPIVHIQPVDEAAIKELEKRVMEAIEG